jgi:hypothetical protein
VTLSFTVVLGLFLLAPGLAAFAGLYHGSKLGRVEGPPPPPGSILALSIVTVGAMVAHLAGATAFWLQDVFCSHGPCFRVEHEPNVYVVLFTAALTKSAPTAPVTPYGRATGTEVVTILLTLVCLTWLSFASARATVNRLAGKEAVKGMLYGWLSDLAVGENDLEAVLAYVVSDVQEDGTVVGYEGVVANMTTNAEKEITSILLDSCEIFYLRVSQRGVSRRESTRDSDIGQLYLDRSHIKNVAFERVKFVDDGSKSDV